MTLGLPNGFFRMAFFFFDSTSITNCFSYKLKQKKSAVTRLTLCHQVYNYLKKNSNETTKSTIHHSVVPCSLYWLGTAAFEDLQLEWIEDELSVQLHHH